MIELETNVTIYRNITNEDGTVSNVIDQEYTAPKSQDQLNAEARAFLADTDWKVIRHMDELNAGVETSLTVQEYQDLFLERRDARNLIQNV